MSKLKDISGELMFIATMPPEKRNDKLSDLAVIIQGWKDYEIAQEQKDLITTIIEGLIAENDADQIAKSKLVFVPDVEEQIAPTKKTRAKKVVAPVLESILEDLPDDIKAEELLDNLPDQVLKLAVLRNKQEGKNPIDLYETLINPFKWDGTPEGEDFWSKIHFSGDLTEFKRIYGNKGEKVDEVIEFAGLTEFVEGLSQPVVEAPAPAVKTRKPRTPKATITPVNAPAPVVATQEVKYVEVIVYPPSGGVLYLKVYNDIELIGVLNYLWKELDVKELTLDFRAITDSAIHITQITVKTSENAIQIVDNLKKRFDTFIKLDFYNFQNSKTDFDIIIALNKEILKDAFTQKLAPVVAPKPVKVVTPKPVKVVTPKPAKVVTPKPVKVVAPKVVKPKVTKPKVEDDLSFLNDLDNIF